jgi:predicted TIM-barrel fold metal-dependent hydrolase
MKQILHHTDAVAWGCDTHVHVIGDTTQYPMVSDRRYTPGPASTDALKDHLKAQALGRVVIVQPSVYGTDNQCLLDALSALGPHAKGIAVLEESITNPALQQLDACGIRGIRLNFESSANHNTHHLQSALIYWSSRIAALGWHIQVYAPFAMVAACAPTIRALPTPVVLDHFALWPRTEEAQASDESHVLELLNDKRIYIKLSASYRQPNVAPQRVQQLAHRLLQIQPECLLWGSDWPHTQREPSVLPQDVSRYRAIASHQLCDERLQWLRTPELQHQVLVANPAKLYRF